MSGKMRISRRSFLKGTAATAAAGAFTMAVPEMKGNAAEETVEAAHSWEVKPEAMDPASVKEIKEADVVVVGAGPSGFSCAVSCAENGLSVIMIEKDDVPSTCGGAIFGCNSEYQKSIGYEVDEEAVCNQYLEIMGKKVNQKAVWKFFDRSGECLDWLGGILGKYDMYPVMQGIGFADDPNNCAIPGTLCFYGGANTPTDVTDYDPYTCDLGLGFVPMVDYLGALEDYLKGMGAEIDYNTSSVRILREEGEAVTGIIAENDKGEYIQYNAAKAVVIAAGDYGQDPEMMEYYCPQVSRMKDRIMIFSPNTGDLHKQAMWVGAAMQRWPDHAPSGFCGDAHPIWNLNVNEDGVRFTNENTSTTSLSWAILQQKDGKNCAIFDENYASELPYVPGYVGCDIPTAEQEIAAWDKLVDMGVYCKADTIEELAEKLELNPDVLKDTIEKYNKMCEEGKDTEFHKRADLLFPLSAPYYGFKNGVCMLTVHGGLHVDEYCHVLQEDDNVIPGLYAVGLAAGDFWANSYTTRYAGISHGHNFTTGYLVGRELAGLED